MFLKNMIIGVCVTGFSVTAVAADGEETGWTFVPSLAYQQKQLSFDQQFTDIPVRLSSSLPVHNISQNGRKSHFKVDLPTANLSLTASHNKFYIALKYEQSLADATVGVDETRPPALSATNDPYFLNVPKHDTDVKRSDKSITFGFNAWSGLNIFMGYMAGKTRLTPSATCYTFPLPCTGRNLASDLEAEGRGEYYQQYTEEGPYLGISYGWQISDVGTLSVSFAHASMNARFKDNYVTTAYGDEHFDFTGNSVGTSFGATWSAPVGEFSAYFLDIRRQKYSMKGADSDPATGFGTVTVATDETMLGVTAGLQFYF